MDIIVIGKILGGLLFLVFGGDLLVRGASNLAKAFGIPSIVIGLTIVALGTSAPELAVSIEAALIGRSDIAVANIVGSNIFNILFILGVSALICPLIVNRNIIKRDLPLLIGISVLIFLFSLGGVIGRVEGAILFVIAIVYTYFLIWEAIKDKKIYLQKDTQLNEVEEVKAKQSVWVSIVLIIVGLGIIMIGADWLIQGSVTVAKLMGVSDTVIGLTIIAVGTSLPEVVASIIATIKGERDIAIGNVIGSNIYNILIILGASAFVVPGGSGLTVNNTLLYFDIPVMIAVAVLCFLIFWTGRKVSRFEGAIFLFSYIGYMIYLIRTATIAG